MSIAVANEVGIYSICHTPPMRAAVDPAFLAFDVVESPQQREVAHLLHFWREGHHRKHRVTALLSSKFGEKTGWSGRKLLDFIAANPGQDAWLVNPFPELRYLAFNIWEHGEFWHPGLMERAAKLIAAVEPGVDLNIFPRSSAETLLFCNFWAGTEQFWDRYMERVEAYSRAAEAIPEMLDSAEHYSRTTYFPFFFERYFTTFLTVNRDVRSCAWKHSKEETLRHCGTEMELLCIQEFGDMIEKWDARGSYDEDQRQFFRSLLKFCQLFARTRAAAGK